VPDYTRPVVLGKNVAFTVRAIAISATGQITYDNTFGTQGLQGRCDRAVRRHRIMGEDVSALDANIAHYANYKSDWDLILSGIKMKKALFTDPGGTVADPLETMFAVSGADGIYVVFTAVRLIFEYWGVWNDYEWPVERVKNVETLSIRPIDMGATANPRITVNPSAP
jgi:hypothetical protein